MKKKKKSGASNRVCEPSQCDHCQYVGDGDFLCDKLQEIVVSDWLPTENYLACQSSSRPA